MSSVSKSSSIKYISGLEVYESQIDGLIDERINAIVEQRVSDFSEYDVKLLDLVTRKWTVIKESAEKTPSLARLRYVTQTLFLDAYTLPILNEMIDRFISFRNAHQEFTASKYMYKVYGDISWVYNFDEINNPNALALVFLCQSKRGNFNYEDVKALNEAVLSNESEVVSVAKCLLNTKNFQVARNELYSTIFKACGVSKILNEYFDSKSDQRHNVEAFFSPNSISLINSTNAYFSEHLKKEAQGAITANETLEHPSNSALAKMKMIVEKWKTQSTIRNQEFVNAYDQLIEKRNKLKSGKSQFVRAYLNHDFTQLFETFGIVVPNLVQHYEACKTQLLPPPLESAYGLPTRKKGKKAPARPKPKKEVSELQKVLESKPVSKAKKGVKIECEEGKISYPPLAFNYAPRVIDWFTEEPEGLKTESYSHLSPKQKKLQHLFHGFSQVVDNFVNDYAFKTAWINSHSGASDALYLIPGEIRTETQQIRGLFSYCKGADSLYYHRYFSIKSVQDFLDLANPAYYEVDFPPLGSAPHMNETLIIEKESSNHSFLGDYIINPLNKLVTIKDTKHNATLYLYKHVLQ